MANDIWQQINDIAKKSESAPVEEVVPEPIPEPVAEAPKPPEAMPRVTKVPEAVPIIGGRYLGKKPPIPKNWNAIVLRRSERDETLGYFEHIDSPVGMMRPFVEKKLWGDEKRMASIVMEMKELKTESDALKLVPFEIPDKIHNLPSRTYRAVKGCDAFTQFLAYKQGALEKIKIVLFVVIIILMLFLIWMMASPAK